MSERQETANYAVALGRAIRVRRLERGLTIAALACKARMSAVHLGKIERGKGNPRLPTLCNLAGALEILVSVIFIEAERDVEHKEAKHAAQTR